MKRVDHSRIHQGSSQQYKKLIKYSTLAPYIRQIEKVRRQTKYNKTHSSRSNPHNNASSIRQNIHKNESINSSSQFRIKDIGTARLYLKSAQEDKDIGDLQLKLQKRQEKQNIKKSQFQRSKTVYSTLNSKSKVKKLITFIHKKFRQKSQKNQEKQFGITQKLSLHNNETIPSSLAIIGDTRQARRCQAKRIKNSDFSMSAINNYLPTSQRSISQIPQTSKSFKSIYHMKQKATQGVSSQREIKGIKSVKKTQLGFGSMKASKFNSKGHSLFQTLENTSKVINKDSGKIIDTIKQHSKQRSNRNNFRKNKFQDSFIEQSHTPMLTNLNVNDQILHYMRKDSGMVVGMNDGNQKYPLTKQQLRYRTIKSKQFNVSVEKSTQKYLQQEPYRILKSNNDIQIYVSTVTNPSALRSNPSKKHVVSKNNDKISTNMNSHTVQQRNDNQQQNKKLSEGKIKYNLQGVLNYQFQFEDSQEQNFNFEYENQHQYSQSWLNVRKDIMQDESDVHIDDLREHIGSQ